MSEKILALDIGSTKICAIIAQITQGKKPSILGFGISKSQGLKKGAISNIELASKAIKFALNDAKRISGVDVKEATISISGTYTKNLSSSGIVHIEKKEITIEEIKRVMETSLYNAHIPQEYEVLHVLPYNFKVDDQNFIENPLGMNASRLEVEVYIITTQKANINNLKRAVNGAGLEVKNIILNTYASSIATLNEDEKKLGVALIDIGGSTSNIAIHIGNSIQYHDFLTVGSNHITNDLSIALHTPLHVADVIKLKYASLLNTNDAIIEIPTIGDIETTHEASLNVVSDVVYARVEETLSYLNINIEKSILRDKLGAGIVITGGLSNMKGLRELATAIFGNLPVRLAKPKPIDGLFKELNSGEYATVIGLVMYSAGAYTSYEIDINKKVRHRKEVSIQSIKAVEVMEIEKEEVGNTILRYLNS